jgi:5'-deoxynucleotidase YfbR-like HD superfamily hydrolase
MYFLDRELYTRAWNFSATAHLGQTVPGSELPYIVHVGNVALVVMTAITRSSDVEDPDLAVQCALLHDVIEDTAVSYEQVVDSFGTRVADGVLALTKNPDLADKSEKMEDSLMRIRTQPEEVWMVKMADRISNLQPPPSHWSTEKIVAYRQEAIRIHQALHTANAYLSDQLSQAIDAYGPHRAGAGEARDADAIPNLPADFQLEYYWRGGTVPPPYHYEYRVRLDASGNGEVLFHPDYPPEQPPEWRESFAVPPQELQRLYQEMMERKVFGQQWELIPDMEAPIGGELESLEIVVNAQRYTVPSAIVHASRVDATYRLIRSLVPETTWQSLMERREAYIRERLGE